MAIKIMSIKSIDSNSKLMISQAISKCSNSHRIKTTTVQDKRPKVLMLLPWDTNDMEEFLKMLQESVILCPDEVRPGLYHSNNIIFVDVTHAESPEQDLKDKFWSDSHIRAHQNSAILKFNASSKDGAGIVQKNSVYDASPTESVWVSARKTNSIRDFFSITDMKVVTYI